MNFDTLITMIKASLYVIVMYHLIMTAVMADTFTLTPIMTGFNKPWGMSFITDTTLLLTEKSGSFQYIDLEKKTRQTLPHNLNILVTDQGGLLDILVSANYVYVSYSENRNMGRSSTSIARAPLDRDRLTFSPLFQAQPPIKSGYHFGSRLAIQEKYLFATIGERGKGMIAQDGTQHPGSIIRIHLDGSIPTDNPKFIDKRDWQPEIFQIGVRNPQGIAFSSFDSHIYISNHGARGGDWFGRVEKGGNYGWKILGWGGIHYSGAEIGPKWQPGYSKPITYWTPSLAVGAIAIYDGHAFKDWRGAALVTSLKDQSLRKIRFDENTMISETILFKGNIGRIRDIEIHPHSGDLFLLGGDGRLWMMQPPKH